MKNEKNIENNCEKVDFEQLQTEWCLLQLGGNTLLVPNVDSKGNKTGEEVEASLNLSEKDIQDIFDYHQKKGLKIPIDANHTLKWLASEIKVDEADLIEKDPSKAGAVLGFGELHVRDDGIYIVNVSWNTLAKKLLETKQYKYFSPVLKGVDKKSPLRLTSVSLTNQPRLSNIQELVLAETQQPNPNKGGLLMNPILKQIATLFGYDEATLEDDDTQKEIIEKITSIKGLADQVETEKGDLEMAEITPTAFKAGLTKLKLRNQELEMAEVTRSKEALISTAMAEGKVTNAMKPVLMKLNEVALAEVIQTMPKQVPTATLTNIVVPVEELTLSEDERKFCKQSGIDEKAFHEAKKQ